MTRLAYEAEHFDLARCTGTGTWRFRERQEYRREGVELDVKACDSADGLSVAGTRSHPELFTLLGDPDAGDVRRLRKG